MEKNDWKLLQDLEQEIRNLRRRNDLSDPKDPKEKDPEAFQIEYDAPMAAYTSFRAGGRAKALIRPQDPEELRVILRMLSDAKIPHLLLGNGSNVLFRDSGYDGAVIKMENFEEILRPPFPDFPAVTLEKNFCENGICAACGVSMSALAKALQRDGLTGFEFAGGIPGTLGGGLFMNAGAYGGELKDVVRGVLTVSPDGREERFFTGEQMQFGYRRSVLQDNGYLALYAFLQFSKGDPETIAETMRDLNQKRSSRQPVQYPSAGSTFKRPEGYFAGKLIEDAGLKGVAVGGAQVSTLHSGFIINRGGASATDILQLIRLVQNTVYDRFGVMLEPEVRIIG